MKTIILWGAAALFAIVLMIMPAVATNSLVTVYGTVTDERSNPVQGANVTLIGDTLMNGGYQELGSMTSDARGNFLFKNIDLAGSSYIAVTVSFSHDGTTYATSLSNTLRYDPSSGLVEINLNDTRLNYSPGNSFTAYGTVTDLQDNRLAGASVTLIDSNLRTLGTTTTDANGNFSIVVADFSGSDTVKAKVSYVHDGQTYNTSLENVRWYDPSSGLVNLDPADTRLYNYPPGNHGYVWGVVLDSITGGKAMDSKVYLKNNTETLSMNTSVTGSGSFRFEVTPGDYVIYAVHDSDGNRLVSNQTTIHVYQSNDILLSAPITLIVDQNPSGRPVEILPLAAALILGVLMVFALWAILGRKR